MGPLSPGVEPTLKLCSQADARTVSYLKTLAEFLMLIDSIGNSICVEAITWLLDNPQVPRLRLADAYRAWIAGDLDQLAALLEQASLLSFAVCAKPYSICVTLWMPRIATLLSSSERTLIAVGSGHLPGTNGLLTLLRQQGRDVRLVA